MASIDLSTAENAQKNIGSKRLRRKRRRLGFHVDTTPLVDVAFLLLTFFLLTTRLIQPQVMPMGIPKGTVHIPIKDDNLFTLYISDSGNIYYTNGATNVQPISVEHIGQKSLDLITQKRDSLVTSVKATPNAPYNVFIRVLDELQLAEYSLAQYQPEYAIQRHRKFTVAALTKEESQQLKGL